MFGRSKSRHEDLGVPPSEEPVDAEELSDEERSARLGALVELIEMMRPAVQADGGDLVLVDADVARGRVEVMLQGSCSSCAISSVTLQAGVERILTQRLPWVTSVVGRLDETLEWEQSMALGQGGYVPRLQ
jgi:Fe-S cluster biogenesis protein NfuA